MPGRIAACRLCGQVRRLRGHGLCGRDYQYWWRHGTDRPPAVDQRGQPRPCQAPGCHRLARELTRGWCKMHSQRWYRLGRLTLA